MMFLIEVISIQGDPDHPIAPVMLEDARLASQFADQMLERDIYVVGFSYPVVPKGWLSPQISYKLGWASSKMYLIYVAPGIVCTCPCEGMCVDMCKKACKVWVSVRRYEVGEAVCAGGIWRRDMATFCNNWTSN